MLRQVAFITIVLVFFISIFSNCGENSTELSEKEVEWYANKQFRTMRDTVRKEATANCDTNYAKYLQQKVDSLIVEHLKNNDTSSYSKPIE